MKTLNSLKSRGYVKEQFAWRHYYWYLTNEGIQYLRDYLHLPPEIVPSTLKRQARAEARPRPSAGPGGPRSFGDKPDGGDRAAYRRAPGEESYFLLTQSRVLHLLLSHVTQSFAFNRSNLLKVEKLNQKELYCRL